jgi:putative spermidine/putrescine transport system substrate-binding protein
MKNIRRRDAIILGSAAALASSRAYAQEPPKPAQVVVNHSGGSMGTAMRKAFFNGFEKKYGIRVVETSPADFGKLRAMVDSGNVEWDVTEIGGQDAIRATEMKLVEKIDDKIVDRSKYPEKARSPWVFASSVYTTIIGYRTDVFKGGTQPKSWADWWDVKKFPARVRCATIRPTTSNSPCWPTACPPTSSIQSTSIVPSRSSTRSSRM